MERRIPTIDEFINESMQSGKKPLTDKQTKEFNQLGHDVLHKFDDICKKHKIKWWVDWGTLLGWHRDGDFLPDDGDLDVTMRVEDLTPEFVEDMKSNFIVEGIGMNINKDLFNIFENDVVTIPARHGIGCALPTKPGGKTTRKVAGRDFKLDLWFLYPYKTQYFVMWGNHPFKIPAKFLEKFSKIKIGDRSYNAPSPIDDYLQYMYVGSWKEPIKRFGWSNYAAKKDVYFLEDIDKKRVFAKHYIYNFKDKSYSLKEK